MKAWQGIITICTIIAFAFGAWSYIDSQKADAADVQQLEKVIYDYIAFKTEEEYIEKIQEIKDKYGPNQPMSRDDIDTIRFLEMKVKELKETRK